MSLQSKIDVDRLPQHLAIIMDGNGRWAKQKGMFRYMGHENGTKAVREIVTSCAEINIPLSHALYAFSTENWNRPKMEVELVDEATGQFLEKGNKNLHR